jgi:hypothetical protein
LDGLKEGGEDEQELDKRKMAKGGEFTDERSSTATSAEGTEQRPAKVLEEHKSQNKHLDQLSRAS